MYRLPDTTQPLDFPDDDFFTSPEGLLALGGNLHPQTLLNAYRKGIFPWFSEGDPILWWHPNPRLVLFPEKIKISRSLKQKLKRASEYPVTYDQDFIGVISRCQEKRGEGRDGTWITAEILTAYTELHKMGFAHSVETRNQNGDLIGGLYGVQLGKIFFGESMFSDQTDASKITLAVLCLNAQKFKNIELIDCQVKTQHLMSMGAEEIDAEEFRKKISATEF